VGLALIFERVWLLLMLGLVAVPIWLHLRRRRRALPVHFSLFALLAQSQKQMQARSWLRHWLLLVLRVLVLVAFVFAVAGPYDEGGGQGASLLSGQTLYLVDDSLSMPLGQVQAEVSRHLETLSPGEEVLWLWGSEAESWSSALGTGGRESLLQALASWPSGRGYVDMPMALERSCHGIRGAGGARGQVVVVTDFRQGSWFSERDWVACAGVRLAWLEVAVVPWNVSIQEVAQDGGGLWVTLEQSGATGVEEVVARVEVGGDVVFEAVLPLVAGRGRHRLEGVRLEEGAAYTVRLLVKDGLAADDTWHAFAAGGESVRVLVVNGDSRNVPLLDEAFFLERALRYVQPGRRGFTVRVRSVEGIGASDLAESDVVVLANVGAVGALWVESLKRYVSQGGSLLMTMGERTQAEAFQRTWGDLLPRRLRGVRELAQASDEGRALRAGRVSRLDWEHPVLRDFLSEGGEMLQRALVYRYMQVETDARAGGVILALADGAPLLVEAAYGAGRVMLLTTSVDRDWTDLPLRKAYLPLMHSVLRYLAGRRAEISDQAVVGVPFRLGVLEGAGAVEVRRVGRWAWERAWAGEGEGDVEVVVDEAGIYEVSEVVRGERRMFLDARFAANVDRRESEWRRVDGLVAPEPGAGDGDSAALWAVATRRGWWPWLLLLVVLALLGETVVACRRRWGG